MIIFTVIDGLLEYLGGYNPKVRWYAIHYMTNAIVVATTIADVYTLVSENKPTWTSASLFPSLLVMALHLFHCIQYRINRQDIIHHGVMSSVLLISIYNRDNNQFIGPTNYALFFLSGLPGGIDYFLMVLVELGRIRSITEKYYNQYLNTWIRSVGILYAAFYAHREWLQGNVETHWVWPIILALVWNAQYYSSAVAQSYARGLGPLTPRQAN